MTHDEMIAVITAFQNGKAVQFRHRGDEGEEWSYVGAPTWNFDKYDYRIEPEPREFWVQVNEKGGVIYTFTHNPISLASNAIIVHVREVMP